MTLQESIDYWKKQGEEWKKGNITIEGWELGEKKFKLSPKQIRFVNDTTRYCLYCGSFACGKTLSLLFKTFLLGLFFPKNRILIGRKTIKELEQVTLPDLFDIIPENWYEYRKADGIITLFNGSQFILFGLDALQEGSGKEIKKAEQAIKSLNLGGFVIDQLEEVEERVFTALTGRLRRDVGLQQGNFTTNPENFWAYDYFKANPRPNTTLYEGSMMENKDNLSEEFLQDQMSKPDSYKQRYVYGEWSPDVFTEGQVFYKEYIDAQLVKEPEYEWEGAHVFKEPDLSHEYNMGIDPSEGITDPGAIIITDKNTGEVVLSFKGLVPAHVLTNKAIKYGLRYNEAKAIPEKNGNGLAVVEGLIQKGYSNIYMSRMYDKLNQTETERVGWITSVRTKRLMISDFHKILETHWAKLNDKRIIDEMRTFVWTNEVKKSGAGAQSGFHDDMVMAAMMAYQEHTPTDKIDPSYYESLAYRRKEKNDLKPELVSYR